LKYFCTASFFELFSTWKPFTATFSTTNVHVYILGKWPYLVGHLATTFCSSAVFFYTELLQGLPTFCSSPVIYTVPHSGDCVMFLKPCKFFIILCRLNLLNQFDSILNPFYYIHESDGLMIVSHCRQGPLNKSESIHKTFQSDYSLINSA
jgi:hypothetical protein